MEIVCLIYRQFFSSYTKSMRTVKFFSFKTKTYLFPRAILTTKVYSLPGWCLWLKVKPESWKSCIFSLWGWIWDFYHFTLLTCILSSLLTTREYCRSMWHLRMVSFFLRNSYLTIDIRDKTLSIHFCLCFRDLNSPFH